MQKQVFTGIIYSEFYTPCQNFRPLVSSWEVGITTCEQVVNKATAAAVIIQVFFMWGRVKIKIFEVDKSEIFSVFYLTYTQCS